MSNFRGSLTSFLPLGPVTSNSFPKAQETRPAVEGATPKRRASSLSIESKSCFRVLKVAPVHFGEHAGDHQEDWHDVRSNDFRDETIVGFLTLAPVTSTSYPMAHQIRSGSTVPKRRTSSMSSDGTSGFRVLKVAPVHNGAHVGEHQEDWHDVPEVAVE